MFVDIEPKYSMRDADFSKTKQNDWHNWMVYMGSFLLSVRFNMPFCIFQIHRIQRTFSHRSGPEYPPLSEVGLSVSCSSSRAVNVNDQ
jgi:hypothetical protein